MAIRDIVIKVVTDASGVDRGMTEATSKVATGMEKVTSLTGIGYAAMGAAALSFGKQAVDAASQAEKAQTRLTEAYRRFPSLTDVTLKQLNELADATLRKSRYDDDAARAAIAMLAQYNLTGREIQKLMPVLLDYATVSGKDLPDAAQALGLALLGNTRGLKAVGIEFKATGDHAKDLQTLMGLLNDKVGGAAAADLDTYSGSLAQMQNQVDELKEAVGTALIPVLLSFMELLTPTLQLINPILQKLAEWYTATQNMTGALGEFVKFLTGSVFVWLQIFWSKLVEGWGYLKFFAGAIADAAGSFQWLADAISGVIGWLSDLWGWLERVGSKAGKVISKVGKLNPFALPPLDTGAGAPVQLAAWNASSRAPRAAGPTGGGTGTLTVNVNIHGNVGNEALVGARVVNAIEAYTRRGGQRRLQQLLTPWPA